ncbi:serine protease [Stenotrophomonas rhizophila]|nr:serine protease [Stenotrophomonas rhizophila]
MVLNPATQISLCTVRIEAHFNGGANLGTGYLYNLEIPDDDPKYAHIVPVMVTNKHVVDGADHLQVSLDVITKGAQIKEDGSVPGEVRKTFRITDFASSVIRHPDSGVDLCVVLLGHVLNAIDENQTIKNVFLDKRWRLDEEMKKNLRPIEPVAMIGYPNGIWDSVNNKPIARRGQTASHALVRWNNNRYFVIDTAVFGGSSGSPVFLYEDGLYRNGPNGYTPGMNVKLLGTLWGGPVLTAEGKLVPKAIPTAMNQLEQTVPQMILMMNLGFVVHVDALDDFIPIVKSRL